MCTIQNKSQKYFFSLFFLFICIYSSLAFTFFVSSLSSLEAKSKKNISLLPIATNFKKPLQVVFSSGDPFAFFVVEQGGIIYRLQGKNRKVFLNISTLITSDNGEEGLLSLAFPPSYNKKKSYIYINYTAGRPLFTHIVKIPVIFGHAKIKERRTLLHIQQPYRNHNGGMLLFGPDRRLYIGTGDGGSAGDPLNSGQDRKSLLGKILRIDVNSKKNKSYNIPHSNPFFKSKLFRKEIYAWGLRNPWRFSFDSKTKRLYVADVGQNRQEEINLIQKGGNYGWRIKEGRLCYKPPKNCYKSHLKDPIHVYNHKQGQSITGGYVYRGKTLPLFWGHYFFADYVSEKLWALPISQYTGRAIGKRILILSQIGNISSFGEDNNKELYLVEHSKGIIYKMVKPIKLKRNK